MAKGDNISCESDNAIFQHNNNFYESDNPPTEHDIKWPFEIYPFQKAIFSTSILFTDTIPSTN